MEMMWIYNTIGLAGFLFFIVSAMMGGDPSGADIDVGGHHFGHHSGHHHDAAMTSNVFTVRNLFLFAAGFGAAGAISTHFGVGPLGSGLWGAAGGIILAFVGTMLFALIQSQQSNSLRDTTNLVGKEAMVNVGIPEGGLGEVFVKDDTGSSISLQARATAPINSGQRVKVESVSGNTAFVVPL